MSKSYKTEIMKRMNRTLKSFPELWMNETLNKTQVIHSIRSFDPKLLDKLLADELIGQTYTQNIGDVKVFKRQELIDFFREGNGR
ncbi:hypothetical protein [Halobacillus amylolyticus]|uniref:Type III restriction/modification enzyme methylation subunit domain-containing protein n=1 Tax=Halobacillus amylolyticus TaxID=2932259 RepID=A0ABY4H8H5_9BACI|nr:hypothetical protein [Halobacillus amylolyticus]UOR11009.1 hypothetical protein MUO15_15575 [Halobacillus amylolyticus]